MGGAVIEGGGKGNGEEVEVEGMKLRVRMVLWMVSWMVSWMVLLQVLLQVLL